jgi:hypothetical protein
VVSRTDVIRAAARAREVPAPDGFWEALGTEPEENEEDASWFLAPESAVYVPVHEFLPEPRLRRGHRRRDHDPGGLLGRPGMLVWELADFLVRGRIHRALVVEEDRLVGIVTAFDVMRVMAGDASS